jgi:hypothetical protein
MPWTRPPADAAAGASEIDAYSADVVIGAKRLRHLRPPMIREYRGERYVIIVDDGDVIAVFRVVPDRPSDPERLLRWPFEGDDVDLA